MRLIAALQGNLEKFMADELKLAEAAVTGGVHNKAEDLKNLLRDDVVRAGLGRRLSRSWRLKKYPKHGGSLSAAAVVFTKAPKLIDAFESGEVIRSKDGFWLAIPTPSAPKLGSNRKRINPSNFPEHRLGELRFVYRPSGVSLLVVDNQRKSKGKRGGYALSKSKRALSTGHGLSTVPMFFLVPQVRLKRRLNVVAISDRNSRGLAREIDREFRRLGAHQDQK